MMVVMDSTFLLAMFHENIKAPIDVSTGNPVTKVTERIALLIDSLRIAKTRVMIPTPALAELLHLFSNRDEILTAVQKNSIFVTSPFDVSAAVETACLSDSFMKKKPKAERTDQTYAKLKYDRQIVAIARVNGIETIYSDDGDIVSACEKIGIKVIRISELPVPPEPPQKTFEFDNVTN